MGISRLQILRQKLECNNLELCLISNLANIRYLTGFTGSTGWLVVTSKSAILAVDFRYTEQVKNESSDCDVLNVKGDISNWLPQIIADLNYKTAWFESDEISFNQYHRVHEAFKKKDIKVKLIPTSDLVESLRSIKDAKEQELISKAANLASSALEYAKSVIAPSLTEIEIAWKLESYLREHGSEVLPFEVIVASGPNSALPHAKSSHRQIQQAEPILIDIGARINGYCSDLSRTFLYGKADKKFSAVYDVVLCAQLTALATIECEMNGDSADKLARSVIEQAKYGNYFGHGLGHGVGLAVHESPRIGPMSSDILCDGMVFTVEPGIYITGWGGVRIEDTVVMQNGKITNLSKVDKIAVI